MKRLALVIWLAIWACQAQAQIVVPINNAPAQLELPEARPNPLKEDRAVMILNEEWRTVEGYEGIYEVSSLGRVRSLPRVIIQCNGRSRKFPGKILQFGKNASKFGYLHITLCDGDRAHITYEVHRLVATAFIGPCPDGYVCNHIDANPGNNIPGNLEWVTQKENIQHAIRLGLITRCRGEGFSSAKLTSGQVVEIRRRYAAGGVSQRRLADEYGVHNTHIRNIIIGRKWRHLMGVA